MGIGSRESHRTHRIPVGWNLVLWSSSGDGNKCCGIPAGMKNLLRDSRGNVAVRDFYGASAPMSEFSMHFFHVQNFWCMLTYNNNAN